MGNIRALNRIASGTFSKAEYEQVKASLRAFDIMKKRLCVGILIRKVKDVNEYNRARGGREFDSQKEYDLVRSALLNKSK